MFNSFIPFFIIIFHQFLIPFSNAIPLVEEKMLIAVMKGHQKIQISQYSKLLIPISNANPSVEDDMLIAFVKGQEVMPISEYSKQKYEAHLGIVYFMRKNWQCDKIGEKFEEYERTECQKYPKYLDILYEYLYREYAGIHTVKPKFILQIKYFEIEGPIIYVVQCFLNIYYFYFVKGAAQQNKYKLNYFFYKNNNIFEPKLLNQKRLNYEVKLKNGPKLPINEMILQLAIDTANECQTNESVDGIIRQKFDKNLKEMLKKAKERMEIDVINYDNHKIIVYSKFDDQLTWTEDALFLEFVKGLATNFEKFFKMTKEYSNLKLLEFEKMKEKQKCTDHLGAVYLLRKILHCEKIGKEFHESERKKCQKYRKYLNILYEYLFRLYAEAKNPKVSKQLPPLVKPIFIDRFRHLCLTDFVKNMNEISEYFLAKKGKKYEFNYVYNFWNIKLVNEEELNYEIKEEKIWFHKIKPKGKQILNGPTDIERIREEFEQKMGEFGKKKEKAKKGKAKLEKAMENAQENA